MQHDVSIRIFFDHRDQTWVAISDELEGCSAGGDTPLEALQEFEIAVEAWIEALVATGKPMPQSRRLREKKKRSYQWA